MNAKRGLVATWFTPWFVLGILSFCSCAVVSVLPIEPTTATMTQAISQMDKQSKQSQSDYESKERIWREVQKKPPENKGEVIAKGSDLLSLMADDLQALRKHQGRVQALQSEFQQTAGNSKQISEHDARWENLSRVKMATEASTNEFNASLRQYTERSNQLSSLMGEHHLFAQIKPEDLVKKLNEFIAQVSTTESRIGTELDAKETQYNQFRKRHGPTQQTRERSLFLLIEEMSEIRNQLQLKIRRLEQMRDDFSRKNQGRPFVRSFEPAWEQVETIRNDHVLVREEVDDLSEQYTKKSQVFATSLKEGLEESAE